MYEKILQKLKEQRQKVIAAKGSSNVSDRSLEDLARSLEPIISTDEILNVADLSKAIESIDGNINHYTAEQIKAMDKKKQEEEAKKAAEEAAKKAEQERLDKLKGAGDNKDVDIASIIAESIKSAVEPLTNQISELKGEKIATTRVEKMNEILKDAPEYYKNQIITGFNNMSFKDDDSFNSFLDNTKTNFETFQQQAKEQGLNTSAPKGEVKKEDEAKLNPVFEKAMKAYDEQQKKE